MSLAVEAQALSKTYRIGGRLFSRKQEKTVQALTDVHLAIEPGEVFGVIGRNGYGKTTLVKCIASLLLPSTGWVRVFGQDTRGEPRELRQVVGWVGTEERSFYFRLTGRQNLSFFGRLQGLPEDVIQNRITELGDLLEIADLLDRRFHEYSTGNKHRLSIARGLLHDPRLLMLDEPTRSLDPFAADRLRGTLRKWIARGEGRTIIITSHNLAEIEELSDRVAVMSKGHLRACGPVEELRRTYGAKETIGIQLESKPEFFVHLEGLVESVSWETDVSRGGWLRFDHQPGDEKLGQVVDLLRTAHMELLSVEREELRLQDIIDRVDAEPTERVDTPARAAELSSAEATS